MCPEPILFPVNFVNWMKRDSVLIFVAISVLLILMPLFLSIANIYGYVLFLRGRKKEGMGK